MDLSVESSREIEERAAAWLARRDSGLWSDSDGVELERWLSASTAHRVAYLRLNAAWREARRFKALGTGGPPGSVPPPGEWNVSPFFEASAADFTESTAVVTESPPASTPRAKARSLLRGGRSLAFAAGVVLAVAVGAVWFFWPMPSSYRTEVGGLASVPMSDGSRITLNTATQVRVVVTERERRVELEEGEAFFDVAKDPQRPFTVTAGRKRIVVVGTQFSVFRNGDEVRVVVAEGSVRVEEGEGAGASEPTAQLKAGSVARAADAGVLVQEKPLSEVQQQYLSWRTGYLAFRETALVDAVAEMNRYNTHKIVIEDPAVEAIRLSGTFRATNFEGFVRLLEEGFPIRAQRRAGNIVLTKS
jgi:transmembrane sensor